MITGIDYVFVSNIPPIFIESPFLTKLQSRWKNPIIEEFDRTEDRIILFFAKDEAMVLHQDQNGFTLNEQEEGGFMLYARKINLLQGEVKVLGWDLPKKMRNIDFPYESHVCLHDIWEYTLVLPAEIKENHFSKYLYDTMTFLLAQKML